MGRLLAGYRFPNKIPALMASDAQADAEQYRADPVTSIRKGIQQL
jgi:hypothetical protein